MRKNILIGLFAIAALTGCKKDLEILPTDTVPEEVVFTSVPALQKGLNTAYARYHGSRAVTAYTTSLTSDEVKFGANNGGSGQFAFRLQYGSDNTSGGDVIGMWYSYYSTINMVNRVLQYLPEIPATGADLTTRNQIEGQLKALRAMSYFDLLQAYSKRYNPSDERGVVLSVSHCLTCEDPRSSSGKVMEQIEKDLAEARDLVPVYTAANYNDLVLNQLSVTAFQARVAQYKGEWQKAADLATAVINSGIKPLVSGTAFQGIWTDANTNETLFRGRFENAANLGGQWTATNGNVIFSPSDKLLAAYSASDIRRATFIGTNTGGNRFVRKFSQSSRGASIVDIKSIRTAEMYLIRAEARAELNDLAGAAADIDAIRAQRISPAPAPASYSDKTAAINDILLERFRELSFEGFRFFDLKRRNLDVQRAASDVDSPLWQTLTADNYRFVYPIPFDEILANRSVVQNDGY